MDETVKSIFSKSILVLGALAATLAIVGTVNAAKPTDQTVNGYTKDQCKNGGWQTIVVNGKHFKNQGDCVSYFATGGKNGPAGS